MEENKKGIGINRVLCIGLVLAMLTTCFLVGMPGDADVGYDDSISAVSKQKSYTPHDPISINGNAGFTSQAVSEGWAGDGTEGNPYIIKNYDINASSAHGIKIRNTNAYFIIRNCVIHDGYGVYPHYYGIYFYNVQNGKIDNVTSYNNNYGVYLYYSSNNNTITNCAVYNNSRGISLDSSSNNNTITNCAVYNNSHYGIELYKSSNNNTITNCDVYNNSHGIELQSSSNNNTITNCDVYNNEIGIMLGSSSNNNQITNCDVYYNSYGIYLSHSSNNQITNCAVYNNDVGIYLPYSSNNNTITNCDVYNNSFHGIWLYFSSNNNITNCAVYNNSRGIYLDYSSNNNITNCAVYNNYDNGIRLDYSSNNILRDNVLENNTYNFGVLGWDVSDYEQDIDTSNTINGKPIYYIIEQSGLVFNCFQTMSTGYLGLISCSNILVENCTFTDNIQGLLLVNTSYATITNCAVYNNEYYGIWLDSSSNNEIHYNNIYGNTDYGVYNWNSEIEYQANATHNWWGEASGPGGQGPGSGDNVSSNVLYDPWLTEPWTGGVVNIPPIAHIDSITPNPATEGKTVTFTGHGTDTDGTIVAYNWRSSKDGQLSTLASFSTSSLSVGTHTIYFKVQDNNGAWSSEVSDTLVITTESTVESPPAPKEEPKGFIPGFETVFLLVAVMLAAVVIVMKKKKNCICIANAVCCI